MCNKVLMESLVSKCQTKFVPNMTIQNTYFSVKTKNLTHNIHNFETKTKLLFHSVAEIEFEYHLLLIKILSLSMNVSLCQKIRKVKSNHHSCI